MITVTRVDASTVEWRDGYGNTHHGYADMVLAHPEEYPTAVVQAVEYGSTGVWREGHRVADVHGCAVNNGHSVAAPMSADEADVLRAETDERGPFPTLYAVYVTFDSWSATTHRMNYTTETREDMEDFIYSTGEGLNGDAYREATFTIVRYEPVPSPWF